MRIFKWTVVAIGAVAILVWTGAWMIFGPTVIRVENDSARVVRSIEITGTGFNSRINWLEPGESACVRPSGMRGESGLEFRAETDAGTLEGKDLAYLEASGYHVQIDVSPDMQVHASYGSIWMAFCSIWR